MKIEVIEEEMKLKYWQLGNISSNILAVKKGMRLVSQHTIRKKWVDEIIINIKKNNLNFLKISIDKNYDSVYFFHHLFMGNIIKYMNHLPCNENVVKIWINGKMFGYSDEEIKNHIKISEK